MARPLFFIGNKRSGTSHLSGLLKLHPQIYVTTESDVIWLLYQAYHKVRFRPHPMDDSWGLNRTIRMSRLLMRKLRRLKPEGIRNLYFEIQQHIIDKKSHAPRTNMLWVGDKKPAQQTDPDILNFTCRHFPDAKFIHIIRNPQAVIGSMTRSARRGANVPVWKQDRAAIFDNWAKLVRRALAVESDYGMPVYTLRFEDLCNRPVEKMIDLFNFLGTSIPGATASIINERTQKYKNLRYQRFELPTVPDADELMEKFGYKRKPRGRRSYIGARALTER